MNKDLVSTDELRALVAEAERAALENVRAGGGPFGAVLCVGSIASGKTQRVGAPAVNAVLATGLPGAHAEDQVLSPEQVEALKKILKAQGAEDSFIVLASSAESCPACHTKAEIFCRLLIGEGLLLPGRFILAYGVSYRETFDVAGFNDEPYLKDLTERRLIAVKSDHVPPKVAMAMKGSKAVVVLPDGRLFTGGDGRHFTLKPEISAIHAACEQLKCEGAAEPWNLRGATLYSHSQGIGPLAYTACQWANVTRWVTVTADNVSPEAPDISNEEFFRLIATRPYNGVDAAVRIVRVEGSDNLAQKEWRELMADNPLAQYNGVKA